MFKKTNPLRFLTSAEAPAFPPPPAHPSPETQLRNQQGKKAHEANRTAAPGTCQPPGGPGARTPVTLHSVKHGFQVQGKLTLMGH